MNHPVEAGPRFAGTDLPLVTFVPVAAADAEKIAGWIADDKAREWLDLGSGRQQMGARELFLMLTSPRNHARLFHLPGDPARVPLGLVCLNDVANQMGSADVWGVRGAYAGGPRNLSVAAFLGMLATGFVDHGRAVIGSWVVEGNGLSVLMHRRLGLTESGRQRQRHRMGGCLHDRLLFDITRAEFAERYPLVCAESGRCMADLARAASEEMVYA